MRWEANAVHIKRIRWKGDMEDMTKTQHYNSARCHTWSYALNLAYPLSHVKKYKKYE